MSFYPSGKRPVCLNALVNLSEGTTEYFETHPEILKKLIGGRGLNMYYLYKYLKPGCDPLSEDNVLIIGNGMLTGMLVPNSGRHNVTCKSPETGIIGDANIGGFFGPEMRFAGIDRLIIVGKAAAPVYLYIENGRIEIRDASQYWGLTCSETYAKMKYDLGSDVEIEYIGPAGENRVRYAATLYGLKNAAGRCGTGAVWGSKNLKAIVARGNDGLPVADPEGMLAKYVEIRDYLNKSKVINVMGRVGTPLLYDVSNYLGAIRTHNSQQTVFFDTLNAEEVHKYVDKMLSCFGCAVHCRHRNRLGGEGPEYSSEGLIGANIGVADTYQMIDLQNLVNDLGLDVSSAGSYISWAIELFERGYIDEKTAGRTLRFGDYPVLRQLIVDIAYRRGFGDELAEGSLLVEKYGKETADFLIAVKGLPQSDPHDVRYLKGFALGIATSSRGADHLRSRPTLEILDLPAEVRRKIYGEPIDPNPTSYNSKGRLIYYHENIFTVVDCVGICKFICHGFNSPRNLNYTHFKELIKLAYGLEFSEGELEEAGKRVINLERLINYQEKGISRKDDTLPARYFDEPMPSARAKGNRIDRDGFNKMLDDYYTLRGWDLNGLLPAGRVEELKALRDLA